MNDATRISPARLAGFTKLLRSPASSDSLSPCVTVPACSRSQVVVLNARCSSLSIDPSILGESVCASQSSDRRVQDHWHRVVNRPVLDAMRRPGSLLRGEAPERSQRISPNVKGNE